MSVIPAFNPKTIGSMSDEELERYERELGKWELEDRKNNSLLYYTPVSERAEKIHYSKAKIMGVFGGNRSGKTTTPLVHAVSLSTGVVPKCLMGKPAFMSQFRGPMQVRIVCESLTTTLHQVMLHKLRWWTWNGFGRPGSDQGHFGWLPRTSLIDDSWEKSWSEKIRTLRMLYRDPYKPDVIEGESTFQFLSKDQDVSDHASGEFDLVIMDEPPSYAIYQESIARVMSRGGRVIVDMTWPPDPTFDCEWLFDSIYDKGQPGPNKDPHIEIFNLFTVENPNIDQGEVAIFAAQMSETERQVRIYGQPIRFSNRVHPLFTDQPQDWCTGCLEVVIADHGKCTKCQQEATLFSHVEPFDVNSNWPVAHILDCHPRKAHMGLLVQIDPSDDWWVLDELVVTGDPVAYKLMLEEKAREHKIRILRNLMDPNMGGSPAGTNREVTWQTEFEKAGVECELADDGSPGRTTVDQMLRLDRRTLRPRITVHPRCTSTILQMKRYCWDDYRDPSKRGMKQTAGDKHSDFPTLLKYLANDFPTFQGYRGVARPIRYGGALSNGYTGGGTRAHA